MVDFQNDNTGAVRPKKSLLFPLQARASGLFIVVVVVVQGFFCCSVGWGGDYNVVLYLPQFGHSLVPAHICFRVKIKHKIKHIGCADLSSERGGWGSWGVGLIPIIIVIMCYCVALFDSMKLCIFCIFPALVVTSPNWHKENLAMV